MLTLQNYVGNVQRNLCRSSLSSALLQMANLQRQDTVLSLSLPEAQKLRFQGEKPLRCASRLLPPGSRNVAGPVSTPPAPAPPRCAGVGPPVALVCATRTAAALPASTRNRTGGRPRQHRQRVTGDLREKQKHRKSLRRTVAAVAALPACWLAPAPGASSPESALGVGPRLPQHEPGDLDTRDSEGENEPTLWAAPILVLF